MKNIIFRYAIAAVILIIFILNVSWNQNFLHGSESSKSLKLTAEERLWLDKNHKHLHLFFNTEFPPIEFVSPGGDFTGMGADVMKAVEEKLGVSFPRKASTDWNKHLAALEKGECAIAPTIVRNSDRERYAFFSTPYAKVPVVIIATRAAGRTLDLDSLKGYRVAVVSGFATEKYIRERSQGRFSVVTVKNVEAGLRAVAFGQADALVENLAVAAYYIEKEGIPNLRVSGTTDYYFAWSIGVSRKYPLLFSSIQKALSSISEDELKTIRKRWISLEVQKGLSPELVYRLKLAGFFVFLLLISLAGISWLLKRRLDEKVASLKSAQAELLEQAERLRLATEATKAVVWDYYPVSGEFLFSDELYSMPKDGGRKDDWQKSIFHEDRDSLLKSINRFVETGGEGELQLEFRMKQPDDTWCWVIGKGRTISRDEKGAPTRIIGLNLNIQNIKEVQEQLIVSESRFRSLFMLAPIPLVELQQDGTILMVNHKFTELLGYTVEDVPTVAHWFALAYPDPEYREEVTAAWASDLENAVEKSQEAPPAEYRITGKDGSIRTMLPGLSVVAERSLVSFFDITDMKQAELEREKLQVQLLHSQKMEAIGVLAGGVAHDFNNMLGGIMGYTQLTMSKMASDDPLVKNLEKIMTASVRSSDLVRQLLAFARKQTAEPVIIDINKSVEAVLKILERIIGENITLAWQPGEAPGMIKIDPSQLDQILTNLCVNARDAIDDIGKISIDTGITVFDEAFCHTHKGFLPGEHVVLSVSDNGSGMDAATMEHVFEPFFTTKGVGKGTGLGLATVYGIVKQNEGFVDLYSGPGEGTTFKIYFPSHGNESVTITPMFHEAVPASSGETLLIVEDDPLILDTSKLMLEDLGYSVLSASAPGEALALAEGNSSDIQLVLTDVVMPEMNGKELAEKLKAIIPGVKIIFMSGYAADVIKSRGFFDSSDRYLQKPFTVKDLAVVIHESLYKGS